MISIQNQLDRSSHQNADNSENGPARMRSMSLGSGPAAAPHLNNSYDHQARLLQMHTFQPTTERYVVNTQTGAGHYSVNYGHHQQSCGEPNGYHMRRASFSEQEANSERQPETGNWRHDGRDSELRHEGTFQRHAPYQAQGGGRDYGTFGGNQYLSTGGQEVRRAADIRVSPSVHQIVGGFQNQGERRNRDMPLQFEGGSRANLGYASESQNRGFQNRPEYRQNLQYRTSQGNESSCEQSQNQSRRSDRVPSQGEAGEYEVQNQQDQDQHTTSRLESDASMLLRSELLDGNQPGMDYEARPPSALQQKLHRVQNVFTAIRENLNEASSEATSHM